MNCGKMVIRWWICLLPWIMAGGGRAEQVTIRFNAADLLNQYSTGGYMSSADSPRRLYYEDTTASDNYMTWGATYADSLLDRYDPNDPDFSTALANYEAWLATNPKLNYFNLSFRPYDGMDAWGQELLLGNPPADWSVGNDAMAALYYSASVPSGWACDIYWDPWSGPAMGFYSLNPDFGDASALATDTASAWFEITGNFMVDTNHDGIADVAPVFGDSIRMWMGTSSPNISTTTNEYATLGVDVGSNPDMQLNGVIGAMVTVPEPSGGLLVLAGVMLLLCLRKTERMMFGRTLASVSTLFNGFAARDEEYVSRASCKRVMGSVLSSGRSRRRRRPSF